MRVIDKIAVPTLIITAADDPFVPPAPFREPAVTHNQHVTVVVTPQGGHCGFVEKANGTYDGYWAEREIIKFVSERSEP
jgi:predicted alpha/beta-fold hydrolase